MNVVQTTFGKMYGQQVSQFTITNDNGMVLSCINYGCIITKVLTSDRHGNFENVVLGFDTLDEYQQYSSYFGAVVGRVAGRIKNGRFSLNGKSYSLPRNENQNHLHGGIKGFSQVIWNAERIERENEAGIEFTYLSPDGEEGYPGNLEMKVTYLLNNQDELTISYDGISDQSTLLSPTNHSYFNLSGNLKRDILDHELIVKCDQFFELNPELLPTGKRLEAENTPFDFNRGRKLREGTHSFHPQNRLVGNGYDHPLLLSQNQQQKIDLIDWQSGRELTMETDQPGMILYTGNQLENNFQIRGVQSRKYLGICLETMGLPGSVGHPASQTAILGKNHPYHSQTKYKFKGI